MRQAFDDRGPGYVEAVGVEGLEHANRHDGVVDLMVAGQGERRIAIGSQRGSVPGAGQRRAPFARHAFDRVEGLRRHPSDNHGNSGLDDARLLDGDGFKACPEKPLVIDSD
jgi:hypothetical protein